MIANNQKTGRLLVTTIPPQGSFLIRIKYITNSLSCNHFLLADGSQVSCDEAILTHLEFGSLPVIAHFLALKPKHILISFEKKNRFPALAKIRLQSIIIDFYTDFLLVKIDCM